MLKNLKLYYVFIALPFASLLFGFMIFSDAVKATITGNPYPQINYTIITIIISGGVIVLFNARRLMREAKNMVDFSRVLHAKVDPATLQEKADSYTGELACISQMVATSSGRSISHQEQAALEHELANVHSHLNRRNALPSYLTGLLVAMGLLGTFIGLLATLQDIATLIGTFAEFDMKTAEPIKVFAIMIERMKAPMGSMAIAFSSSMFGLLGSIILGLMMLGIRRLQGDITSTLNSEVGRHIEIALSFESISLQSGVVSTGEVPMGDASAKILLRIEERLAEAARSRQRALSAEIEDFKKQRADMLRALTEQTEANNNFRTELQQLGTQLGGVFNVMDKGNGEISTQISELTVHMAGDAKETHKLLAMQVDEQKELRQTLDSDKTDEGNKFHNELQQIGTQLGTAFNIMEKGNDELSARISELTAHMAGDAKETHELLAMQVDEQKELRKILDSDKTEADNNFCSELQKIGTQLGTAFNIVEKGNEEVSAQISELAAHITGDAKESHKLLAMQVDGQKELRDTLDSYKIEERLTEASRLQQRALSSEIDDFKNQRADMLRTLTEQTEASNNFRTELQQLGRQLGDIFNVMEKGNEEISAQISEMTVNMTADAKQSHILLNNASNNVRSELQQLGSQLASISNVTGKNS